MRHRWQGRGDISARNQANPAQPMRHSLEADGWDHVLREAASLPRGGHSGRSQSGMRSGRHGGRLAAGAHTAMTLTNVVFPEFCSPTRVSSISCLKKRLVRIRAHVHRPPVSARHRGRRTARRRLRAGRAAPAQPREHLVEQRLHHRAGRPPTRQSAWGCVADKITMSFLL